MSDRLRIPSYIPELDGLRGIAIALVLVYHCHTKLESSHLDVIAKWGWVGVNLFFVLSGFLITGIIIESRDDPHFFRNFYARRGLRIWPVYFLLLLLNFFFVPLVFGSFWWAVHEVRAAPWTHYIFFIQNLLFAAMPGTLGPTWSLAIEEQFYVFWAPIARFAKNAALLPLLIAVFVASPFIRLVNAQTGSLTQVHTLTHLDGLAIGSLIALSLRMFGFGRATWKKIATGGIAAGVAGAVIMQFHGSNFTDTLLALGFGGMLVAALLVTGKPTGYGRFLTWRPLKYLGTISYGLYLIHILCFVVIGDFDLKMAKYGMWGDLSVVAVRMVLSIAAASLLWYGFERPILRLKRYFVAKPQPRAAKEVEAALATAD
jgi:peptidoglycan/LPS O-acetylase OafA/YrhL